MYKRIKKSERVVLFQARVADREEGNEYCVSVGLTHPNIHIRYIII